MYTYTRTLTRAHMCVHETYACTVSPPEAEFRHGVFKWGTADRQRGRENDAARLRKAHYRPTHDAARTAVGQWRRRFRTASCYFRARRPP